ncbi:MAG: T9SS C-terminal target domain-containing protein [Calditrichaeota bacterium]|nr:MAG: T9SS C-terminal target domain-containing protein [Calditrichota bacterium]
MVNVFGQMLHGGVAALGFFVQRHQANIIEIAPELLARFRLCAAYPNPFNPSTMIRFDLTKSANAKLEIFNVLGQRVRVLLDERKQAGRYTVQWDGTDDTGEPVVSGVYYYKLHAGDHVNVEKMTLVR